MDGKVPEARHAVLPEARYAGSIENRPEQKVNSSSIDVVVRDQRQEFRPVRAAHHLLENFPSGT